MSRSLTVLINNDLNFVFGKAITSYYGLIIQFLKNKFIYFIYLFLAALGLRCCAWAFSSCGERGLLFVVVQWLLSLWSMGCRRASFSSCGAQAQ